MAQASQRPKKLRPSSTCAPSQTARNLAWIAHARRGWSCCCLSCANSAARSARQVCRARKPPLLVPAQGPLARHQQVVLALVVTPEGFPVGYEFMPGNTLDQETLPQSQNS